MISDVRVYVSIDSDDVYAGHLYSHRRRGNESASFGYDDSYLTRSDAYALDPQLPLVSGRQQTAVGLALFRAFADSSPDRWGRNLLWRRERARAREQQESARSFGEFDLLLGVRDDLRQGATRFRARDDADFLATDDVGVPLLTDLPGLLGAADRVAADTADFADLSLLVRAGSSLGGARPKAHVLAPTGALAIAKFPSPSSDKWNVMAWEKSALDIARSAGVHVPDSQLVNVAGRDVLVVDRFDRVHDRRIGYASALTMLEADDGDVRSYLDIAAVIEARSGAATEELAQLWRRIALSILISNTDDHLRNHGFLHQSADVWALSPAFDLNPNPDPGPKHLSTAIDGGTAARLTDLMALSSMFRLRPDRARRVLSEVARACTQWRAVAQGHGLSKRDVENMAPAFEHDQADEARLATSG